jgi:N-acetyl sugar amidotransferase
MNKKYQVCSRCIMDTNDYPEITFDEKGVCSICHIYDDMAMKTVKRGHEAEIALNKMLDEIKKYGKNREYDCLIGVSGGVDSTYLSYKAKEWGLKPLILHVDNGWNTELSVMNIEQLVKKLGYDLFTYVIDWNEIKDLQLSYMKASVLDIDVPTDNAYAAAVFKIANEKNIKYILTGHNTVTEGWLPPTFTHFKYDIINMKAIHKKFGKVPLKTFPYLGITKGWYYMKIKGLKTYSPLNWIDYDKNKVKDFIQKELGWRDYGGKHYENIFTRFYQGYILFKKFGVDKRKSHLSTLICSGQITREKALEEIKSNPYPTEELLLEDREYLIKKLGITEAIFEEIMNTPVKKHTDYPSILHWYDRLRPYVRAAKRVKKAIAGK